MDDKEDKKLYAEFLNGNNEAFEKLIEKYRKNVIYLICKYTKNIYDAEDIFQNLVVFLMENKYKYNNEHSFKVYLYVIAKSRTLNFLKNQKNHINIEKLDEMKIQQDELLEEIILKNEKKRSVIRAINRLKDEYSCVIYLTQIEELSYKDVAIIMNKTPKQIKNMLFYAKKKLKVELEKEGLRAFDTYHNLKKMIIIMLILINLCGVAYASIIIYNKYFNAKPTPVFSGKIGDTDINSIWSNSFQITWQELSNQINHKPIEFETGQTELINKLNNELSISNKNLLENSYYIVAGKSSELSKEQIKHNLEEKFSLKQYDWLNNIDFNNKDSYIIYSILYKNLEFLNRFYRVENSKFGKYEDNIKYFGNNGIDGFEENVTILFYENKNEFSIKLNSNGNDNLILYRTNSYNDKSFEEIYFELEEKSKNYIEEKNMQYGDRLTIPYMKVDTIINYDELCGKYIKGTDNMYISNAIQNVKFSLNDRGVNIYSEANISKSQYIDVVDFKELYFNDTFIIFAKEDSKLPYFALKVDNTDLLEKEEM